jgi:hypothetical protein
MLTAIKLLHTVIWAILAGSIVVLPLQVCCADSAGLRS